MCLAVPGQVISIDKQSQRAKIDYSGLTKEASIMLLPDVHVGDYVLVHAGFIIQILADDYAHNLQRLTEDLGVEG